jgi:hypothetical protein
MSHVEDGWARFGWVSAHIKGHERRQELPLQ